MKPSENLRAALALIDTPDRWSTTSMPQALDDAVGGDIKAYLSARGFLLKANSELLARSHADVVLALERAIELAESEGM